MGWRAGPPTHGLSSPNPQTKCVGLTSNPQWTGLAHEPKPILISLDKNHKWYSKHGQGGQPPMISYLEGMQIFLFSLYKY